MKRNYLQIISEASQHSISDNPGYGFHGTVDPKLHASKKPLPGGQKSDDEGVRASQYKKMHAQVRSATGADAKTAKHYLDSVHGRHLADVHNDVKQRGLATSHVTNHIKKDFEKFKKHYKPELFEADNGEQEAVEQIDEATYTPASFDKSNDHPTRSSSTFIKGVHGGEAEHIATIKDAAKSHGKTISHEHAKKIAHHPSYHEHAYKYRHDFARGGSNGYDNGVKKLAGTHIHHPNKEGAIHESAAIALVKRLVKEEGPRMKSADKKPVITTTSSGKTIVKMVTRKSDMADSGGETPHDESTNGK